MKNIAFYSRAFYTGGMENAVYNLCRLLKQTNEYEITILFSVSNDRTEMMMNKLSTVARVISVNSGKMNFDVLINCDRKDFVLPLISATKTIHWFSSCLVENKENIQGKVVTQSKWHYDKLKLLGIDSVIIGNPLDVSNIVRLSQVKVSEWRKKDEIAYLVVSRISHEKGFDRVIEFMVKHFKENCRLFIIGGVTTPSNDNIKERVQRGLRNKVVFLGEFDNPYHYIAQCDYVLCLSDNEIYGLVSEEAHILGKQVIFNRYPTAKDQFIEGFDMWYDMPINRHEGNADDYWLSSIHLNKSRFDKWKEIIDE